MSDKVCLGGRRVVCLKNCGGERKACPRNCDGERNLSY
jgi:hypothetical protein